MDAREELLVSIATSLNVIAKLALNAYGRDYSTEGDYDPLTEYEQNQMYSYLEDTTIS